MFFRILLVVALAGSATAAQRDIVGSITIYRDTWGVPHIYAKTDAGAAFGLMYAQAEDNSFDDLAMIMEVGETPKISWMKRAVGKGDCGPAWRGWRGGRRG